MILSDLSITDLVIFVNNKLEEGLSLIKIADLFSVNESTIRKKLNKAGYKRVNNKFILKSKEGVQEVVQDVVQSEDTSIVPKLEVESNNIVNINSYFKENANIIIEMVESYKKSNVVQGKDIVVHLPHEDDKSYKISMRVNKTVMEQFKKFCDDNKSFTQKELISMALLEYIQNHS